MDRSEPDVIPLTAYNIERDAWYNMLQVESDPLEIKSMLVI